MESGTDCREFSVGDLARVRIASGDAEYGEPMRIVDVTVLWVIAQPIVRPSIFPKSGYWFCDRSLVKIYPEPAESAE